MWRVGSPTQLSNDLNPTAPHLIVGVPPVWYDQYGRFLVDEVGDFLWDTTETYLTDET